jgi:hypothetical protein
MPNKLTLNPAEESEIRFKIKIEGSIDELDSNQSLVRFTLTEEKSGKGWIFNTNKSDESSGASKDEVSITIPTLKGMVAENTDYSGKLEVILGQHYFTPTEMGIEFKEPLKVEASVAKISKTSSVKTQAPEIIKEEDNKKEKESATPFVIKSEVLPVEKKTVKTESHTASPVVEAPKKKDNAAFKEKFATLCESKGIKNAFKALKDKNDINHTKAKNVFKELFFE